MFWGSYGSWVLGVFVGLGFWECYRAGISIDVF